METRSIYGIVSYLSHSVDIPPNELLLSYTEKLWNYNGEAVDVTPLMRNIMHIYSSKEEPKNAFAKVYLKGDWYYISEADHRSKTTFALLMRLMAIVGAMGNASQQQSPVLTLPVGAG